MRQMAVVTHARRERTEAALTRLIDAAREAGVLLRFDREETRKHQLRPAEGLLLDAERSDEVEVCFVLGGDGSILRALRAQIGTSVPVFAVNFGQIGFLATIDPAGIEEGVRRACAGEFDRLALPAIVLDAPSDQQRAVNDVAIHRKIGDRVADLSYSFDGEDFGSVRCDGLVVATPAGSTGYNLSNGGPIMAWGVEGFAVSFIAPHSLTARALVVAPGDGMTVCNRSRQPLSVAVDGRPVSELAAGEFMSLSLMPDACVLAQLPGSSFYRRLREKFSRLAT